ncbi:TPR-like protein [Athelia psychrophila]|uniref:TPR-like protein n=1 Tax=Athelia psychrophila TaxID=1759441 RepID=A0A166J5L4_9AGAM|nr:TPR-like protein [Fibularhizoctonia sp. CBS 109695]
MVRERGGEGEGELVAGYFPLDVNARHRLAIARIKMGDVEEGKMHANIVLAEDLLDYAPLFAEIADAYFEREMYAEASGLYELLGEDPVTSTFSILLNAAACRRMLGNLKEAVELYKTVIEADPTHNDAKMKLAELYEILDEPRKALELVYQVIDARAKSRSGGREQTEQPEQPAGGSNAPRASLFEESTRAGAADKRAKTGKTPKLTAAQLKELEDQKESEVAKGWKRILELWPAMLGQDGASGGAEREAAEREWMMEAEKLVEMFRETRVLFLAGKTSFRGVIQRKNLAKGNTPADEQRMASRLELLEQTNSAQKGKDGQQKTANVTVFRGLFFDEWMKLFIQYTFQLTKSGQYDLADEILRHVGYSNAYQSREKQDTLHCALISCALHCRKYTVVVEQSRKLINTHQFNNEAIRILVASLASGWRPAEAFILSTLQKFLLRELRLNEAAVKTPEALRYITHSRRYIVKTEKADNGDDGVDAEDDAVLDDDADASSLPGKHNPGADITIPTKHNPAALAVYGQISIGVRSYQTAIYYLLQAYDHAPEDPMICLNLAIASIGRSMQRQADNRHHLVAQGLAFLSRYRSLRKHAPGGSSEVEFNFARAFQQLGLYSHAVKHYERVLEIADDNPTDDTVLSREAAYNLSQIYVITGAVPLARALYRRWLSL